MTCTLKVPAQPLTAAGLATPYVLAHGCSMREDGQRAFVEATISRPDGTLAVYHPLVVDQGKQPAAAPVAPALPAGSTVGVWFGFNGDVLRLAGPGAHSCVNGTPGSPFGQFAYCGAPAFFAAAANAAVPPLGTTTQGRPCPTVRDFSVVDQDQSDNLVTTYVLTPDGRTAQANAANAALGAPITNGSDNGLLDRNIDPALGCTPFMAESLDDPGTQVPSLALNELQADAQQGPPQALIPSNDPFAQVRGKPSLAKVALYRLGVGQPVGVSADGAAYCANLATVGLPRIQAERPLTQAAASPEAGTGLYDFLIARYQATLQNLGCAGAASAGHSSHH